MKSIRHVVWDYSRKSSLIEVLMERYYKNDNLTEQKHT